MWEHLRNDNNEFTFPDNVAVYCDLAELSSGSPQRKESKLSDFFLLPERLGWTFRENGDRSLDSGGADINHVTQRWLYFEVLAQVFGHLPDYRPEDFVKPGGMYITTKSLPKYLESWFDSEKKSETNASETNARKSRLIRIQQVLDKARLYVSQHCAVPSREDKATWEINDLLALSFMILGETLTRALNLIQKKLPFRIEGWCSHDIRNQGWGYSKWMLQKLDEYGWCAKAIHMLQALLRGNSIGLVYLVALETSSSRGPDHKHCTATACNMANQEPERYHHCKRTTEDFCSESRYTTGSQMQKLPNCGTDPDPWCGIDGGELAEIINRGNIPLLEYRRAKRELNVVEMNQSFDKSYAIFSHVWADGFGSFNKTNTMSICVLDMFSKMLENVAVQRSGQKYPMPDFFWIDTLAIPAEDEYIDARRKAISQMHHIYTHAKYTIVLDLGLMKTGVRQGYSNPAMRITMCRWMTRLWTLQEAVLSKNLYFCFSDRMFPMAQLEEMFLEEDSKIQSCIPSLARIYYAGILGEVRTKIHEEFRKNEGWTPQSDFLALVWKAAQWRSTTHRQHETLSLATMLLNQRTEFFADSTKSKEGTPAHQLECDSRMVELLSRFATLSSCPIPPGMIFLPGPKLSKKGYGWAPRSWMSSHEIDSPDPLSLPDPGNTRLMAKGLEVQFPGFLLHDLGFDRKELWKREEIYFPTDSTLLEWYRIQPTQDTPHFPQEQRLASHDLAIIVSRMPVVDLKETALFVAIETDCGGIRDVEILNRVWISRAENSETVQHWSDKHRVGHHEAMSAGERLPPFTKWCVDVPSHPDPESIETKEEAKPPESKDLSNGHDSDQEKNIKPLRRSRTTGFREAIKKILPG